MFTVIGIMFCGIAVGYFFRKVELLQKIGKPISYTILLLLFLLGISVGANESIVNNLTTLGGQALLIASFTVSFFLKILILSLSFQKNIMIQFYYGKYFASTKKQMYFLFLCDKIIACMSGHEMCLI